MASTTTTGNEEEEEEELLLPALQQHPSHPHPLQLLHSINDSSLVPSCLLCFRKISTAAEAYTCKERCETDIYYHRVCVEAPSQIDRHPLHPEHPLPLLHDRKEFWCDGCGEDFFQGDSSFRCHQCDFDLDIACTLSTLSDEGGYQCGKTSEQITLPLHPHPLTSFTKRHDFVEDEDCYICKGSVEEDGYFCLRSTCEFLIHKECIRDLYYADGTKAPRVYHGHPMETFKEEDTGSNRRCTSCGSDKLGELIGCETCQVFYHRNCFQVPEILRYPPHHLDHTFVLFPDTDTQQQCQSCSISLDKEICYRCTLCQFFLHTGCALEVLAYCEDGMRAKIELSWHKHPFLLCHVTEFDSEDCDYCGDELIGPTYVCEGNDCRFLLHKQCTDIESTITHPHHPNHPLTLCDRNEVNSEWCKACGLSYRGLRFTCERCLVDLHVKCAAHFPTHKHYLHEHKLLRLEYYRLFECNRCGISNDSPLFRCVTCNFNLHEDCMELPQVIQNDKIHWHPLTLHDTFLEDDTGEYYCEHCEKTRDPRLGVYVCGYCKISTPRIYHIHCVLPELENVYAKKKRRPSVAEKLAVEIADKREEVRAIKEKLDESTRELDELVNRQKQLNDQQWSSDEA